MKTKFSTKILALVLMLAMIVPMLVFTASAEQPSATLTFNDKSKRIEYSTSVQVWQENGVTLTNNKGSGSNIADYAAPARFYANTEIIIKAPGNITKIVFNCNRTSDATALQNSIDGAATVSSKQVTVTLDGTVNKSVFNKLRHQSVSGALAEFFTVHIFKNFFNCECLSAA